MGEFKVDGVWSFEDEGEGREVDGGRYVRRT